jgi:hypothetical protein
MSNNTSGIGFAGEYTTFGVLSSSGKSTIGPRTVDVDGVGDGRTLGIKLGVGVAVGLGRGLGVANGVGVGDGVGPATLGDWGVGNASSTTISIWEVTLAPPVPVMVTVIVYVPGSRGAPPRVRIGATFAVLARSTE